MKTFTVFLCVLTFVVVTVGMAGAQVINDKWDPIDNLDEENLYEVWNTFFPSDTFSSSNDLFAAYGVSDGLDHWWYETDGRITREVRYGGAEQSIGWNDGSVDNMLFTLGEILYGDNSFVRTFDTGTDFRWVAAFNSQEWYSDTDATPGQNDHFIALAVPDALIQEYEKNNGIDLYGEVFLLGWEGKDLGDADYNDLIVLVDGVAPAPVPEPATMLLLGTGLVGLAGFRRKFKK